MAKITGHTHKWEVGYIKPPGGTYYQVYCVECGEEMDAGEIETRVNASEALSGKDAMEADSLLPRVVDALDEYARIIIIGEK